MPRNQYFYEVHVRPSLLVDRILEFFYQISSYPRLVLEVFIRRDMGDRYFTRYAAVMVAIMLYFLPWISPVTRQFQWNELPLARPVYYVFLAVYCFFAYRRYLEVRHDPSLIDLSRFSKSSGDYLKFFETLKIFGHYQSSRKIDIYWEPLTCGLFGLLLCFLDPLLGDLIMFCALTYGLSYANAYRKGTNILKDRIDEAIYNREIADVFIENKPSKSGVRFMGDKPQSKEVREQIFNDLFYGPGAATDVR